MTLRRRPSLPRCAKTPATIKPCLETLESRIVLDAAAAVNYVSIFQGLAVQQTNHQVFETGEQLGKTLAGNKQGDQRVQADLATLDYTAAVAPLIQQAEALAGNALQSPGGFGAGLGGFYLSADAAAFNVGLAVFAYLDLQSVGANQAAMNHAFNDIGQDIPIFQLYFSAQSIPLGVMPSSLAFTGGQEAVLLGAAPVPAVTVSPSAPTVTGNGNSYTFTASIAIESGIPAGGTVQFQADGVNLGGPVTVSNDSAVSNPITLPKGNHTITALYSGDGFYVATQGQATFPVPTITDVQVAFTGTYPAYTLGSSAQYTVTVKSSATGVNEGTVQFLDNGAAFGSPVAVSNGSATSSSVRLNAANSPHTITAHYTDATADFADANSANSVTQVVNKATPTVSVATATGPTVTPNGSSYTFTASISGPSGFTPTGMVHFFKDSDSTAFSSQALTGGSATSDAVPLPQGNHTIIAKYDGDGNYVSGQQGQTAVSVATISSVQVVFTNPTPQSYEAGGSASYTVTVKSGATGINEGTVQFYNNNSPFGNAVAVSNGSATSPVVALPGGLHTITAKYHDASADFADADSSNNAAQQVTASSSTMVMVTTASGPTVASTGDGSNYTFSVTVSGSTGFTPTGMVHFSADGGQTTFSSKTLSGGSATSDATSPPLHQGNQTITVTYDGDLSNGAKTGTTSITVPTISSVQVAFTSTTSTPYTMGGSASYSVTVKSGAININEGVVQFYDNGTAIGGPVSVSGGGATISSVKLDALNSPHTITAKYTDASNDFATTNANNQVTQLVTATTASVSLDSPQLPRGTASRADVPIFFTATVTGVGGVSGAGDGIPKGTITFYKDGGQIGQPVNLTNGNAANGTATATTPAAVPFLESDFLVAGAPHNVIIRAVYSGDSNYAAASQDIRTIAFTTDGDDSGFETSAPDDPTDKFTAS